MTTEQGKRILRRIRRIRPFVQGSLAITKKRCGNPSCRCAKEGAIHETALLTWKQGRLTRTLYIPMAYRQEVTKWVEEAKRLKRLIAQMSKAQREFLIRMKKSKKSNGN